MVGTSKSKSNWSDLPGGIVELIINKLHFRDQVNALVVCKTWRECKDYVRCFDPLPWVLGHQFTDIITACVIDSSLREVFDPYSWNSHQLHNPILANLVGSYEPIAAKNGWVWVRYMCLNGGYKLFLHNPLANEIRSVYHFPKLGFSCVSATIKGNPATLDYEIFTARLCGDELRIDVVKHNNYMSDSIVLKLVQKYTVDAVLYFDGYIYCLFMNSTLYRYGLEDGSWELLTSGFPEPYNNSVGFCYLMEIGGDFVVVRRNAEDGIYFNSWMIFRLDWSKMSWVIATSLKCCAIYLSGDLAFSSPLENGREESLKRCRLFWIEECEVKCFSLIEEGGIEIESKEYGWITRPLTQYELYFIEPPYFGI